jgi:hypothetical protein
MHVRHALVLVLISAPLAAAEPASDTREAALMTSFEPVRADEVGLHASADGVLAALATTDGNDGQAGGAASVSGQVGIAATPDCDLFALGGQIATRSDDRVVSLQQWATACPLGGDGNLTINHRLEWDTTPRLLAAPRLRPGEQRRETISFDVFGSERPFHDDQRLNEHDFMQGGTAELAIGVEWGGTEHAAINPVLDIMFRKFRHDYGDDGPSLKLDAIGLRLEVLATTGMMGAGPDVATMSGQLGHVEGVRFLGLRFGGGIGGRVAPESKGLDTTYKSKFWTIGEGALSVERDLIRHVTLRIQGERKGWPLWDGRFLVDDRATGSLVSKRGRITGHLDLFAAREHLLATEGRDDVSVEGVTAGAELVLASGVAVQLRSEVGLSAYAPGATFEDPRLASETMLSLAAHAEHRGRSRSFKSSVR